MNKEVIYHYLNCKNSDNELDALIDECIEEVKQISLFKVKYKIFHLTHQPLKIKELDLLLESLDLEFYLKNCDECLVIVCTLGLEIDKRIKYYEHIDMAKAIVFDAVSNAYLEELCDEYQESLNLGIHTFRFAPGYGDIPLSLNEKLSKILDISKLGMYMNHGGLFVPMKSMLGIIGIGDIVKKTCLSCVRRENCKLRKEGQRCYVID